ncbi:MAG TPA: ATP-dependent helicase [Kiritimatiellia bacterium]|nr:ATP-dependent helicase [Kiritimatiellia bacterium]HQF20493.1 ATP-dependent helicase [Kiritimatiellia bacterium]HQG74357.1 ATP-dependent helicase [Kiritimatiellia bacterium]HXK79161.1 ATP-dependent helicase [Kiritimatiellia bacterium]
MSCDFAQHLNEAQLRAVTAPDGAVLVIAAAGTGKTRTLTHRVAWLALERGVEPRRMLLLTFTNRAAREMLERAMQLIGQDVGGLWGGTFHHATNRMLRRHATLLGYGADYSILDEDDSTRLLKACINELGLRDKKFPKAEVLGSVFSLAANRGADVAETVADRFGAHPVDLTAILKVHTLYEQRKRALNAMDFDDLLVNGLKLLQEHESVAARYQEQMQHVLVDEYQDTNKLQNDFVDLLASGHGNLLAVGDDFQSIYSWRGAEVQNILSFERRHPGAQVIKLEDNYRSTPGILDVANRVIAGNPEQYQKVLRATRPAEVKPVYVKLVDGGHQARYIVGKVQQLLDSGAAQPSEIVVLYRSHYHSMELQLELTRARLDYYLMSGVRFFEQAHIKDVCSLPRLAVNPADSLAFMRLMEMLPKVGPKKAQALWRDLGQHVNLRDAAKRAQLTKLLPKDAQPLWAEVDAKIFAPGEGEGDVLDRPAELIFRLVEAFYRDYAEETFENAEQRLEDVEELMTFAAKYDDTAAFLSEMALLTNLDAEQNLHAGTPAQTIRLSTVHQAKGLEWKAVFVLWMVDGMFPAARSLEEAANEAEERRLFYVAVTRAKDYLWLCQPRMRKTREGGVMLCPPSRFLAEIDPGLLQEEKAGGMGAVPRWSRW